MRRVTIDETDRVIAAYAEPASGPGWSNRPVWMIVVSADGSLRTECFQPDEQTGDMTTLYEVSAAAHRAMTAAARMAVRRKKTVRPSPPLLHHEA